MGQLWDAEPLAIVTNEFKTFGNYPKRHKIVSIEFKSLELRRNKQENLFASVHFLSKLQSCRLVAGAGFEPTTFRL